MMLLAGDFAGDCLRKKEDSIDLYNKCRGRQPLKKMAENYIKPGPEGRGRQPHKTRPRGLMLTCERIHLLFDLIWKF